MVAPVIDKQLLMLMFLTEPRRFSDIVTGVGLSPSTTSKYIKYYLTLGFIRKDGDKYVLTLDGKEFIRDRVTRFVQYMIDSGLVRELRLSADPSSISFAVDEGGAVMVVDSGGTRVVIGLGEDLESIIAVFANAPFEFLGVE